MGAEAGSASVPGERTIIDRKRLGAEDNGILSGAGAELSDAKISRAVKIAQLCVEDAKEGRLDNGLASNFKSGRWVIYTCCRVQTHIIWHRIVLSVCFLHSLLPLLDLGKATRPVESGLISVYVADISLKIAYMGPKTFLTLRGSKAWQTAYAVLSAFLFLDALCAPPVQITRAFRPFVLVFRSRAVRNFYMTVCRIGPKLLNVVVFLVLFLLVTALLVVRFLRCTGSRHFPTTVVAFGKLAILLLTQDNYDELKTDVKSTGSIPAIFAFAAVIVVGTLFLLQFVLGTVIDTYMQEAKTDFADRRVKQSRGLLRAFKALDVDETGYISATVFDKFLMNMKPTDSGVEREFKFAVLSGEGEQVGVDSIDFLYLLTVLDHNFTVEEPPWTDSDEGDGWRMRPSWSRAAQTLLNCRSYIRAQDFLMCLDFCVLVADAETWQAFWFAEINDLLQGAFLLSMVPVVLARGGVSLLLRFGTRQERMLVCLALVSTCVVIFGRATGRLTCGGIASIVGVARSLRIISMSPHLLSFCESVFTMVPAITQMLGFFFVVQYFFAAVAVDTMGSRVDSLSTLTSSADTLGQVMLNIDAVGIAWDAATKTHPVLALGFFAFYYVVVVMLVLNLITALMIEFYRASFAQSVQSAEAHQSELMEAVQGFLNQKGAKGKVRASRHSSLSSRMEVSALKAKFLESGEDHVDEDLLKKIKKESRIDLVALLREKDRQMIEGQISFSLGRPRKAVPLVRRDSVELLRERRQASRGDDVEVQGSPPCDDTICADLPPCETPSGSSSPRDDSPQGSWMSSALCVCYASRSRQSFQVPADASQFVGLGPKFTHPITPRDAQLQRVEDFTF
eukprot:TRINITY_DN34498_c0_g1_i1.p1 TRINITY_DN34498_c0_g1~~TRINITY_DN34498_c0_g1_i1.p1  ORF type:complete len:859 (+),score=102.51 TRINITY_DN34498_c0_g1_i1:31-2577(+)